MVLDSERLASFRAVAREGGFSRAAARLHKTQPAVSQAVRALEEDVGETLFVRGGRTTQLTAAGEILLEHTEESFAALERARVRLEALRGLEAGDLTIGTSDTTACYVLPPVLAAFRDRHPGIELRLSNRPSPITEAQLPAREVDVGFVTLPAVSPKLASEPLVVREDVAIFAPDHPLAGRKRVRLAEFLESPLLLLDAGARTRSVIDERLRAHAGSTRVAARIAMELASIEVVKRLVALGFGVSIVPRIAITQEVEAGTLASAELWKRADARTLGIAYLANSPLTAAAKRFMEIAREVLAPPPRRGGAG